LLLHALKKSLGGKKKKDQIPWEKKKLPCRPPGKGRRASTCIRGEDWEALWEKVREEHANLRGALSTLGCPIHKKKGGPHLKKCNVNINLFQGI